MKKVLITGAYGFAGANLTEHMAEKGYRVMAVGRKDSPHNSRCSGLDNVIGITADMEEYGDLPDKLKEAGEDHVDAVIHLAWGGDRKDMSRQVKNLLPSLELMEAAGKLGASRFIGIGSQAEYGERNEVLTEDLTPDPLDAYGACKTAAFYLLRDKAATLGIDFIWGRIFSLIGCYEPSGRMLPDLCKRLKAGESMKLSSCTQYWDYLDAADAAAAITALLEKGHPGEIYNICHGEYMPLKQFTGRAAAFFGADENLITYGDKARPFISLQSSSEKLRRDTGWEPEVTFEESIKKYDII